MGMKTSFKKYIGLFLIVVVSMAITYQIMPTKAISVTTVYEGSNENFLNPERGFYRSIDPQFETPAPPLQLSNLQGIRNSNLSTIRRYYLLSEFRENPTLSQSYLDMISNDCEVVRQAGMKMIVRFTYNWLGGGEDASRDIVLSHIEQIKPILQANYDVIAYMEAGFIGYWGEWHNSSNELIQTQGGNITDDARTIFLKILSIVPQERMVALRYFFHKQQIFNNYDPLTAEEAFNGSDRARTGHHNDAFRYDIGDWGTYTSQDVGTVDAEKAWLSQETKYVVQGGESTGGSEVPGYDDCPGVLDDFARMHWNGMSINQPGSEEMFQKWRSQGCMEEIKRRLGYRFRLVNSNAPSTVQVDGNFSMNFQIANDGFSSPYNPREVEMILRSQGGDEYYLPLNEDPRRWMAGENQTIDVAAGIPDGIMPGEYQLLLNLPDPISKLYNRPEYSIRLANQNVWEESTGYNSLLVNVTVVPNQGETYSGNQVFQKR